MRTPLRMMALTTAIFAACGGDGGSDDTIAPTDTDDVTADAADDADATVQDGDLGDDADVGDATVGDATVEDVADADVASTIDVPGDRNCEYDERYGNDRVSDNRCRPCRTMVGILGDKVEVTLLWWADFEAPVSVPELCEGQGDDCHAELVSSEVFLCKNLVNGKTRVLWNDVADVTTGTGEEAKVGEARGPLGGMLLADIRLTTAAHDPLEEPGPVFDPATWTVHTKDDAQAVTVRIDKGRDAECPVGKATVMGDPTRIGVIAPCQRAYSSFGGD